MTSQPPRHEMVYFPGIMSPSRSFGVFRKVLHTGLYSQFVAMEVPVNGEIGDEVHTVDQVLIFTHGTGKAIVSGKEQQVNQGDVVIVPAGTQHQFLNVGSTPLEVVTIYSPAEHDSRTVHRTKEEGDAQEERGEDEAPEWSQRSGNLTGLTTALSLATHDIPSIILEKHNTISTHPRAIGFTPRSMEIFRRLNIADEVPEVSPEFSLIRARVESLTGEWFERSSWSDSHSTESKEGGNVPAARNEYSFTRGAAIPQDQLEGILETAAVERGVDVRRGYRVVGIYQDETGVVVSVLDRAGREVELRAPYVVAADGCRSIVREKLCIPRRGRGHMRTMRSVLFKAPIEEYMDGVHQFSVDGALKAFLTTYNDGRWVLMFDDDVERDEDALRTAITLAIGKDVPIEILTTGRWELTALVAETFQKGRIFLAGDAAHTLPPNRGGYGANTGIHDADNLAWKLASVVSGNSDPKLLETYDAERRPVALLRHDQIFARADYKAHLDETVSGEKLDDDAMEFGQIYVSGGILGADEGLPQARRPDDWKGQPGTHVPHFWVVRDGVRCSILDVLDGAWSLVSGSEVWDGAVDSGSVKHVCVGRDVLFAGAESFEDLFGVPAQGAVLVRPDGYIAWRTDEPVDLECLDGVLARVMFRV
ncbi:FAD binding domain-containing protein [Aspergillus avenaceus]|uniref:FAD binding domain-containing protein n=1 Tax=Aspergillus avenaceus TaxID=36643 RepID=A0A5N6U8D1_ASPAV|nr:FAD binding domain-containing protein [Aspergillus avenaceus]